MATRGEASLGVVIVAIIIGVLLFFWTGSSDRAKIREWADDNGYVVESIEKPLISRGPYWVKEDHHRIYKVDISDNSKDVWFRFGGFFGPSIEWY